MLMMLFCFNNDLSFCSVLYCTTARGFRQPIKKLNQCYCIHVCYCKSWTFLLQFLFPLLLLIPTSSVASVTTSINLLWEFLLGLLHDNVYPAHIRTITTPPVLLYIQKLNLSSALTLSLCPNWTS